MIPPEPEVIGAIAAAGVLSVAALTGLAVAVHAYIRRVRGGAVSRPALDDARLQRLEHAVDAIAVEVERIGEGQRYLTRLQAERDANPPDRP